MICDLAPSPIVPSRFRQIASRDSSSISGSVRAISGGPFSPSIAVQTPAHIDASLVSSNHWILPGCWDPEKQWRNCLVFHWHTRRLWPFAQYFV